MRFPKILLESIFKLDEVEDLPKEESVALRETLEKTASALWTEGLGGGLDKFAQGIKSLVGRLPRIKKGSFPLLLDFESEVVFFPSLVTLYKELRPLIRALKGDPDRLMDIKVEVAITRTTRKVSVDLGSGPLSDFGTMVVIGVLESLGKGWRVFRCPICNKWTATAKKRVKYCSRDCAHKYVARSRAPRRREYIAAYKARLRFARARGVPMDQIYVYKDAKGRWRCSLKRTGNGQTQGKQGGEHPEAQ